MHALSLPSLLAIKAYHPAQTLLPNLIVVAFQGTIWRFSKQNT
jgi:hypothetical protein